VSERRPYTRYDCETWPDGGTLTVDGEEIPVPRGGIVCGVSTDDNRDSGYAGCEYADWSTWARNRAAFDRIVGVSRRGMLHDVTVTLDGERLGEVPA
jgi:hypothetical protein